jgi:hypothetical protein
MALELTCINPEDIVDCGPEPCFYQVNDPNFGLTGIKWDSTEVEPGETVCYDFTLVGNWTESLGDVTIGLKAGTNVDFGQICGPTCVNCEAAVSVALVNGRPMFGVRLAHNRPPTEVRTVEFALVNKKLDIAHKWVMGPITLKYKDVWEYYGPVPRAPKLPAGEYVLVMKLDGMAGWHWKTQPFVLKSSPGSGSRACAGRGGGASEPHPLDSTPGKTLVLHSTERPPTTVRSSSPGRATRTRIESMSAWVSCTSVGKASRYWLRSSAAIRAYAPSSSRISLR